MRFRALWRKATVLAVATGLLAVSGCTGSPTSSPPSSSSPTSGAVVRTAASAVDAETPVAVSETALTRAQRSGVERGWGDMTLAVGEPVEVSAQGAVPPGGILLTRTYTRPLGDEEAATWAYWDEELGSWMAVDSTVSDDRLSVTAVVHHLSIWTDIVGSVTDTLTKAADWGYYQVGKIFDVRVDSPKCASSEPRWVNESIFIATARNNPILFCTGTDPDEPTRVVVKARVNRGFGFQVDAPGSHEWTRNTGIEHSELEEAYSALADLGAWYAKTLGSLVGGDGYLAPGEEYSVGLNEGEVRALDKARALTLTPPDTVGFLLAMLGQLVGTEADMLVDGYVAAAILIAGCSKDVRDADDPGRWVRALKTCVLGIDEDIARHLSTYLVKYRKMAAKKGGKLAGRIVGRATVYLALIGPVFNAMNYAAERATAKDARTVWVHPTVIRDVKRATLRHAEVPANCDLPAQRLVDGVTTEGGPGGGGIDDDAAKMAFTDLAGLGYKQALVPYQCTAGGVGWPEVLLWVGRGGKLLDSYDLGELGGKEHSNVIAMRAEGDRVVVEWQAYEGAGFYEVSHRMVVTADGGKLHVSDEITDYSAEAVLWAVTAAVIAGDRGQLLDQDVVSDEVWTTMADIAAGQDGFGGSCVSSDTPTRCELSFASDYRIDYHAAMERADNAYGWQVTEVGVGTP